MSLFARVVGDFLDVVVVVHHLVSRIHKADRVEGQEGKGTKSTKEYTHLVHLPRKLLIDIWEKSSR